MAIDDSTDWNQIRKANMIDPTMVRLACVIQQGWPEMAKDLSGDIKVYFQYRYLLHIVDGIIFLQDRIVVPISLRQAFLQKVHEVHLGIVKSRLLGWTLMYWPKWNNDIKAMCHFVKHAKKSSNACKYSEIQS